MRGLSAGTRAAPVSAWLRSTFHRGSARAREECGEALGGAPLMELVGLLPTELLDRALTHASWVGSRTGSYERLEFLGDSVLGLVIASALYERFPGSDEGEMARQKAFVVSRTSCVQVAEQLGLSGLVLERAPASEVRRREVAGSATTLGNVLEAVIGAVYLAFGFERTRAATIDAFEEQLVYAATSHVDHKTALQELLAPRGLQPVYSLVADKGPAHARLFTSEVLVSGVIKGRGTGTTIKMSEQAAAREALTALEEPKRGS